MRGLSQPTSRPEPVHGCVRCGAPVGQGVGLCERCNPLGLRDVAASQAHGTVFVAVLIAVVLLAVLARVAVSGGGPFPATVTALTPVEGGLRVALAVTNEGAGSGQTTCRLYDPADLAGGPAAFVLSPRIEAGATVVVESTVSEFGSATRELRVECRTP